MLDQALTALAAAGGAAVVQAAGTDLWTGLRQAVAGWFGRGDAEREQAELQRLDRTAAELRSAPADEAERLRIRAEAAWQARMEALLENLGEVERSRAAEELRTLLAEQNARGGGPTTGSGGVAVGGDLDIRADGGSIAAGVIH